jgi:SpoVK/Ycf46/Vps4 family AAA+-type ATPase
MSNGTNIAIGMAGGQLISLSLDKFTDIGGWLWALIGRYSNTIKIYANEGGRYNPIYKKMEEYILDQYTQKLVQCNLEPIKGEVTIGLREAIFMKPISVTFEHEDTSHTLYLSLSQNKTTVNTSGDNNGSKGNTNSYESNTKSGKTIVINSRTASIKVLKSFVTKIVKLEKKQSNILTVYRAVGLKKDQTPHWDCLRFKSNKTIENTILKKETEQELFCDVDWFIRNEKWYTDKGIDYKRGYLLHGVPGTGKTSSIKAIANKYGMPIFNIDLDSIKTNNQLISVANDILYEAPDRPYIMAIEDFDRHEMFTDKWSYSGRNKKVTLQCLLNVIDGVVESHGRILVITCNDKEPIQRIQALVRPGRIDRIAEIGFLDGHQTSRLINNYFDVNLSIPDDNIEESVTPAQLIKKMQTSQSLESTLFYICKDSEKIKQQLENDDSQLEDEEEQLDGEEEQNGPPKMDKPVPFKDDEEKPGRRSRRNRYKRRRGNPGKNPADKKAWTIKQKEKRISDFEKINNDNDLRKRKLELELEYDKERYVELRKLQDERDAAKKVREALKKQRERERAKKKREREKAEAAKQKAKDGSQPAKKKKRVNTKAVNVAAKAIAVSVITNANGPYVTRSGRTIKPVIKS